MKKSTKGFSIISREAAEERRQFYMKKKEYWEKFEQKAGLPPQPTKYATRIKYYSRFCVACTPISKIG